MAGRSAILTVKVLSDTKSAGKGLDDASTKVSKFQAGLSKMALPAAAAVAAIGAFGKKALDSASRQEQAFGALDAVFGKNSKTVKKWASSAADNVGLSAAEYGEFASVVGAQLKNLGVPQDQVLGGTKDLISLGADLAATYGGTTADAVGALSAALRGEADPAERYGLALNQTAVKAKLAEKGLGGLKGKALTSAKASAILEMATDQAGGALGQFTRESDTVAGQQQRTTAKWEDAKASLGKGLLPVMTKVQGVLGKVASFAQDNTAAFSIMLGVIGGLGAGILVLNGAMKAYQVVSAAVTAVQTAMQGSMLATRVGLVALAVQQKAAAAASKIWAAAQWLVNAAMSANPIMLVVVAIVAVIAIIVLLWNKCTGFREAVLAVWKAIQTAAKATWNAIKVAVSAVITWLRSAITAVGNVIKTIWKGIQTVAKAVWSGIKTAVAAVVTWMRAAMTNAGNVIKTIWRAIKTVASTAWNGVKAVVSGVVGGVKTLVNGVKTVAVGVWNTIKTAGSTAWNGVKTTVSTVVGAIKRVVNTVKTTVTGVWDKIKSAGETAWDGVKTVGKGAMDALLAPVDAVRGAFDKVVSAVESLIGWIGKIKIPKLPGFLGKLVGKSAPIPATSAAAASPLARGARASASPTLGAVMGGGNTGQLAGPTVIYNITLQGVLDGPDAARRVRGVMRDDNRRRGGVVVDASSRRTR